MSRHLSLFFEPEHKWFLQDYMGVGLIGFHLIEIKKNVLISTNNAVRSNTSSPTSRRGGREAFPSTTATQSWCSAPRDTDHQFVSSSERTHNT